MPAIPSPRWFPLTRRMAQGVAHESRSLLSTTGEAVALGGESLGHLVRGRLRGRAMLDQAAFVGVDALGVALVLVTFSAMVIALQVAQEMARQGAGEYVGALVSLAILRELAPIMTAVAITAMAGSAFAAELSTMRITSQVDALRTLQVSPARYLVLPRLVASTLVTPMMTLLTAVVGILAGMLISYWLADVHFLAYLESVWRQTTVRDILAMLLKAGVFGFLIALLSCSIGLNTRGGAKEVGVATTRAVVWSFLSVAIMDYALTYLIYGSAL